MIARAFIHVAGPEGSGKTSFIEALLRRADASMLVARYIRDDTLDEACESTPANDPELVRYREAGADGVARFRFPAVPETYDDFFMTDLMADYSEAVVLEGDSPLRPVDLRVFVAPPLPTGQRLFIRVKRERGREAGATALARPLAEPGGIEQIYEQMLGTAQAELLRQQPELFERLRSSLLKGAEQRPRTASSKLTEHWEIAPSHSRLGTLL